MKCENCGSGRFKTIYFKHNPTGLRCVTCGHVQDDKVKTTTYSTKIKNDNREIKENGI